MIVPFIFSNAKKCPSPSKYTRSLDEEAKAARERENNRLKAAKGISSKVSPFTLIFHRY